MQADVRALLPTFKATNELTINAVIHSAKMRQPTRAKTRDTAAMVNAVPVNHNHQLEVKVKSFESSAAKNVQVIKIIDDCSWVM